MTLDMNTTFTSTPNSLVDWDADYDPLETTLTASRQPSSKNSTKRSSSSHVQPGSLCDQTYAATLHRDPGRRKPVPFREPAAHLKSACSMNPEPCEPSRLLEQHLSEGVEPSTPASAEGYVPLTDEERDAILARSGKWIKHIPPGTQRLDHKGHPVVPITRPSNKSGSFLNPWTTRGVHKAYIDVQSAAQARDSSMHSQRFVDFFKRHMPLGRANTNNRQYRGCSEAETNTYHAPTAQESFPEHTAHSLHSHNDTSRAEFSQTDSAQSSSGAVSSTGGIVPSVTSSVDSYDCARALGQTPLSRVSYKRNKIDQLQDAISVREELLKSTKRIQTLLSQSITLNRGIGDRDRGGTQRGTQLQRQGHIQGRERQMLPGLPLEESDWGEDLQREIAGVADGAYTLA